MNISINKLITLINTLTIIITTVMIILLLVILYVNYQSKKPDKKKYAKKNIEVIEKALKLYKINFGKYPNSLEELTIAKQNHKPYLKELPSDPWNNSYFYSLLKNETYEIISYGADEKKGGIAEDEDIVKISE